VGTTLGGIDDPLRAGVVALGAFEGSYRQRVPMPLAMWRPGAFTPAWFGPGTLKVGQSRLGILLCWEIGVPWAVIRSAVDGAHVLVGVSNVAWLPSVVGRAQAQQLMWWGRLFRLPVALAMNGPKRGD
jgi:predicted amidohydrolase